MPAQTVTISNGDSQSDSVSINQTTLTGLFVPDGFLGGTITFQTSLDGDTYFPVEDGDGAEFAAGVGTPPCYVPVPPAKFAGLSFLKITSNVNQNTNVTVTVMSRGL